ncbi:hypothetical protein TIFTF001_041638 [Ficus carica]|uniref:CCHC-type domain-containing protein n=1 Tax=Ficus carica TaxID=3494 RepID=A0AA88CVE3_FICCA|nr:hypothetical protein TIFTF001_041637 [Ficus carica]GMN31796.1 hypothetical protein TIFTF001_041638 [Ficus carica]
MVRPRRTIPLNPPEPDLATIVANLQRQLLEQQQETNRLRAQIAQTNQGSRINEPEIPPNVNVPIAPIGVQPNLPPVREDLLYERFRRMKAPEFEGPTDPIAADNWTHGNWWMTVQMRRDVTAMNWQDFVTEFRTMYYNQEILAAQQDEFTNFRQGSMTVMEAIKKFEQLARLCPGLVPSEKEKVRRIMKMFWTDIAKQVSAGSSPPTLVSDCISRAIRAEYWINQDKEARAQIFKAKREEKAATKPTQPQQDSESHPKGQASNSTQGFRQSGRNKRKGNFSGQNQQGNFSQKRNNQGNEDTNIYYPVCATCGKKHQGVCKMGTDACYLCGKEGHYARSCPQNNQNQNPQYTNRNVSSQLHAVQARLEGPSISQGRLEAPEPQARIYAYTNGDAEAGTSHEVTR